MIALFIYNNITGLKRFISHLPEDYDFQPGDELLEENVTLEEYDILINAGNADNNNYNGLFPFISSVVPNTYFINVPTTVQISGGNFDRNTKVNIDGISQDVTFVSDSYLEVVIVCDEVGDVPIEVINTDLITTHTMLGVDSILPSNISDLICWYDFSSEDNLVLVKDQIVEITTSGGPELTLSQEGKSAQPKYSSKEVDKEIGMAYFDGGDRLVGSTNIPSGNSTIFIVFKGKTTIKGTLFGIGYTTKSVGAFGYTNRYAPGDIFATFDGSSGNNTLEDACSSNNYADDRLHILCITADGNTISQSVDESEAVTYIEPRNATHVINGIRLGSLYESGGSGFKGYLGEVVIYNKVLDATEISNMNKYLVGKWRL